MSIKRVCTAYEKRMKKLLWVKKGTLFRKWTTNGLKKNLLKGYALNENRVISNEKYIELRSEVVSINNRLLKNG